MKVCILVCLIFAAGCQGNFLDSLKSTFSSIGDAFTTTFKQVGEQAKTVGTGLLDQLKTQGTQLAGQALQSLLLGTTSAIQGQTGGKRDIPEQLNSFISNKVDKMHETFKAAVDAMTKLGSNSHSSELVGLISTVDEIVHSHNAVLNNLLHELVEGVEKHYAQALQHLPQHKRNAFTDLLSNVGQSVATFFQPHIDGLKQVVSALGQGVTQTAQQMQTTAQPHVSEIQNSGAQVLQHGKNALSALKDAVTDILRNSQIYCTEALEVTLELLSQAADQRQKFHSHIQHRDQTLTQMQPHLTNIAQHAGQIAAQSAGQLATNLGKSVLTAVGASADQKPSQ